MPRKKTQRNKTICTPLEVGADYLRRCMCVASPLESLESVLDRTIRGDMLEVCPLLPKKSVDLIIADPPYNLTKSFNGTVFLKRKSEIYEEYTRRWLDAVSPLLKDTGSIYVCCDWQSSLIIGSVLGDYFCVRNRITWQREKGRGAKANWKNSMEDIWFATASSVYTFNCDAVKMRKKVMAPYRDGGKPKDWVQTERGKFRDTCPSNFWDDVTVPFWSMAENTAHPTQKAEKLAARMILASSREGDVVLDPFLGSGTTSVAAKKLRRHYVGIEQEAQYCVWAEQRLAMADENSSIQGYADGVFWERNALAARRNSTSPLKDEDA